MNTNLAIVGIFWDGYYDMWEDFLELKEKFWKDCPYPLYIINQTKKLNYERNYNVTVINAGSDAEYSKKIQIALEKIDSDYLLLLLDDFFFSKELSRDILESHIKFMKENSIKYYSMPLSEFLTPIVGKKGHISEIPEYVNKDREYTLTCQPTIWERNFLKECIGTGNYNAWVFEGIYAMSKKAHSSSFLSQCMRIKSNPLCIKHGALQGKMIPETINFYQRIGYDMKNKREILDASVYQKHQRKATIKSLIPVPIQKLIKRFLHSNSVYGRYSDQILEEMKRMNMV